MYLHVVCPRLPRRAVSAQRGMPLPRDSLLSHCVWYRRRLHERLKRLFAVVVGVVVVAAQQLQLAV
jgi:hypothetical protein